MKKLFDMTLLVIMTMLISISLSSCHQHDDTNTSYFDIEDSTAIAEIVKSVNNPVFTQPSEFVNHVVALQQEKKVDDILMSLSPEVIASICDVLIREHSPITKENVVAEYNHNIDIYSAVNKHTLSSPVPPDTIEIYHALEGRTQDE